MRRSDSIPEEVHMCARPRSGTDGSPAASHVHSNAALEGSVAQLHFHPPNGSSFDVEAIVWRVDRDGPAFFFTDDHQRRPATLLAQLAGASPARWTSTLN
jgi:hypothetical protein